MEGVWSSLVNDWGCIKLWQTSEDDHRIPDNLVNNRTNPHLVKNDSLHSQWTSQKRWLTQEWFIVLDLPHERWQYCVVFYQNKTRGDGKVGWFWRIFISCLDTHWVDIPSQTPFFHWKPGCSDFLSDVCPFSNTFKVYIHMHICIYLYTCIHT